MRAILALVCGICLLVAPVPVRAWGLDVHKWLTRRALDGLPGELKPFFAVQREFVGEHSVDPDLWRVAGLESDFGDEDPNHFLDLDGLNDPPPFQNVPREWNKMVEKYGVDRANKAGRLPWRAEEMYGRLVTAFRELGRPGGSAYAADNARYLAAVLSHYVEDAHQPFHATVDYDGQSTNQRGIHSRFETELVLRNQSALALAPVTIAPVPSVRDFMFETLIESQALVATVLKEERAATAGRQFYDDAYYAAFYAAVRSMLAARLSKSSSAVASVIVSAWEQGGRPKLTLPAGPRPPAPIRRGRPPAPALLQTR